MMPVDRIVSLSVEVHKVALPRKGKVPLAAAQQVGPSSCDAIVLQLKTDSKRIGLGFLPHFGPGAELLKNLVENELQPLVLKEPTHNTDRLFSKAEHHFREVGFAGFPARAYSLIDVSLWDLKAQSAGLPLSELLGGTRPGCSFFQTETLSTVWDANDVAKSTKIAMKTGSIGVRVRLGSGCLDRHPRGWKI
jgi:L-alanine-DL-glutamate epimerase-like enolase superfamily enzyme